MGLPSVMTSYEPGGKTSGALGLCQLGWSAELVLVELGAPTFNVWPADSAQLLTTSGQTGGAHGSSWQDGASTLQSVAVLETGHNREVSAPGKHLPQL